MASTTEYKDYILGQLNLIEGISCKPMMGEFLLYKDGTLFGGIYDNRLLLKMTETNVKYQMETALPYAGAKPMYLIANLEDKELLKQIIIDTVSGLKNKMK